MHCPRCGTPNEPGDRYCSSCGATLTEAKGAEQPRSSGERLRRLVGTTRTAKVVTIGTAVALIVAIVAFFALGSDDEEAIPRDAYTISADQLCLQSKRQIVAAEQHAATQGSAPDELAAELVPIVVNWRGQFQELSVPADRVEQAQQLETALLGAIVKIGGLARADSGEAAVTPAKEADAASAGVEEAVASLGLTRCSAATIGFTPS